ncbi:uncharacterized mitochondrial protein-like protein, partial [Tanacetum coccineum]
VASLPKSYLLFQSKYILDLFDHARMTDNKIVDIPLDAKAKYTPTNGDPLHDPSLYCLIVGSLVYLTVARLMLSTLLVSLLVLPLPFMGLLFYRFFGIFEKSKKHDVLSRSSTEADYRVMAVTTSEIV